MFFFFCMWLIPCKFSTNFIEVVSSDKLFLLICFLIIGGASLLPDLDSSPLQEGGSTAVYQLGILGHLLSIFFITLSSVIWSLMHTRYDSKPKSQHRLLWHTFVFPISLFIYSHFILKSLGNEKLLNHIRDISQYGMLVIVFIGAISVYLGCSMLFYRLFKLIKKQYCTQFASLSFMVAFVVIALNSPYNKLFMVCDSIVLGYSFHIIGDLITNGSAPIFFPIPMPVSIKELKKWQFWKKPYILNGKFNIETGGVANILVNFILIGVDIFLAWYICIKKGVLS